MAIDVVDYLNHLLHRNNVAILPGFGAFVAAPTPTVIDHARGVLHPPTKLISFNENLKMNDGFLINHIKNKHGISAQDARAVVENFVRSLNGLLESGETILLDKIGKIYKNSKGQLVFEGDGKSNFNPATFGLPHLKYYPLGRLTNVASDSTTNTSSESKAQVGQNQTGTVASAQSDNEATAYIPTTQSQLSDYLPSRKTGLLAAGLLTATLLTSVYFYNKKNNVAIDDSQAIQVSENRLNVKPTKELETTSEEKTIVSEEKTSDAATTIPEEKPSETPTVIDEKPHPIKPVKEKRDKNHIEHTNSAAFSQIVFIGSFSSEKNAMKVGKRLKRKGFSIVRESHNGLKRVGTTIHFNNEAEKNSKINQIKKIFGQQSWEKQ
jgi:cell division septation protein DedD